MKNTLYFSFLLLVASFAFQTASAQQKTNIAKPTHPKQATESEKSKLGVKSTKETKPVETSVNDLPDLDNFRIYADADNINIVSGVDHVSTIIRVDQPVNLTVQWFNDLLTPIVKKDGVKDLLTPLVKQGAGEAEINNNWYDLPSSSFTNIKWRIDEGPSGGKISQNTSNHAKATFTAKKIGNYHLTAVITGLKHQPTIDGGPRTSAAVMLSIPISVVNDEYLTYTLDGKTHINDITREINMEADQFLLGAQMVSGHSIYIRIPDAGGTGSYPFGTHAKEAYIDLNIDEGDPLVTETLKCEKCETTYSSGSVKIIKMGDFGDYIEGEFNAQVWRLGLVNSPAKQISGKFRVKNQKGPEDE